ncbi:MAG: hypothetical protein SH856_00280 [Flavobacteriales bacterium]|nr:hypothetical protein [Flavobacteriales bacterium]
MNSTFRSHAIVRGVLAILFSFAVSSLTAQKADEAKFYGQIVDAATEKRLEDLTVQILKDGQLHDTYKVEGSGKYDFYVPLGFTYDLKFTKDGYTSKFVRIDTRNIPQEDRTGGFDVTVDMSLFKNVEGFNDNILKEPIGKADFDPIKNSIAWDFDYTERMQDKIAAEFERLKNLAGNLDKLKKEFDDLILKGDQKMMEKKYGEAVDKYEAALRIFPEDPPALIKYADAKKKFDEEMANKDSEAKYQKLLADGEKYLKAKNYNDAKKNYQDASNMKPGERLPKDKLAEIEKLLAGLANKEKYDEIIADADSKFNNKDYAVSIEKYRVASGFMPNEIYPKEQITKAQIELDKMLLEAGKKAELEKRYNDLITIGERNMKDKTYDAARNNFTEASGLKPDEQLPIDRVAEIDEILADLAAKEEGDRASNEANAEKERIDKEYQRHIDQGNTLFDLEKLQEAKTEYEAALGLKSNEKYPKTRITRIDEMLADIGNKSSNDLAEANRLKEEEKKKQEEALKAKFSEQERLAEEERLARLDKERLAEEELAADKRREEEEAERLRSQFESNVDRAKEDEVEKYYRDARISGEQAKNVDVEEKKKRTEYFHSSHVEESENQRIDNWDKAEGQKQGTAALSANANSGEKLAAQSDEVNNKKDAMTRIQRQGDILNTRSALQTQEDKAEALADNQEFVQRSDNARGVALENAETKKDNNKKLLQDDRKRQMSERKVNEKQERVAANKESFEKKGDAQRQNNEYNVNKEKTDQLSLADNGEESRKKSEEKIEEKKEDVMKHTGDLSAAATERQAGAVGDVQEKKDRLLQVAEEKKIIVLDNEMDVMAKKDSHQLFIGDKNRKADARSYEKRDELFDKDKGGLKDADDYMMRPGSESIPEGISENSYQLGNKIVIERTLKIGNKVDYYRKVVSKTGIFYFKNDKAITERTWDDETLFNK